MPILVPSVLFQLCRDVSYIYDVVEIKIIFAIVAAKSWNQFSFGFYFRIQEHAYTCRWMSGSHVMVPINILGGSVHVHEMGKRKWHSYGGGSP